MLAPERLSRADLVLVTLIEAKLPCLGQVRDRVERFHHMIRTGSSEDLDRWIEGRIHFAGRLHARDHRRSGCRGRRHCQPVVQWPDRGADLQAETGQTPDVWPRKT